MSHSTGNKEEELEAQFLVHQESYDTAAIRKVRDDSRDWTAAVDGYKLFRRHRQGMRGGGTVLYVRGCLDCLELSDVMTGWNV